MAGSSQRCKQIEYMLQDHYDICSELECFEGNIKSKVRRINTDHFSQYADLTSFNTGVFMPAHSREIRDLHTHVPVTESMRMLLVESEDSLSRYKDISDLYLIADRGCWYRHVHQAIQYAKIDKISIAHFDFLGNVNSCGTNSSSTHTFNLIKNLAPKLANRSVIAFTHKAKTRHATIMFESWRNTINRYFLKNLDSAFLEKRPGYLYDPNSWYSTPALKNMNPSILTSFELAFRSEFKYSIQIGYRNQYVNNDAEKGKHRTLMDHHILIIDKSRIFSDEELYWSYNNCNQN